MNRNVRKRTFGHVRPAKVQISLRIRTVWLESSLDTLWIAKDAKFIHADNEDSDQTAWMRRQLRILMLRLILTQHGASYAYCLYSTLSIFFATTQNPR